jgi:hypothetical protein
MVELELQNKELANEKIQAEIAEIIARTRMEQQAVGQEPAATPQEPFDPVEQQTAMIAHDTAAHELMHKQRMGEVEHQNALADLAAKRQQISQDDESAILGGKDPHANRHDESMQALTQIAESIGEMSQAFQQGLQTVVSEMTAPAEIVYSNGKPSAIRKGSRVMNITRRTDGRVEGLQ